MHLVVGLRGLQMDVEGGAPCEHLICQGVVTHIVIIVITNAITINLSITTICSKGIRYSFLNQNILPIFMLYEVRLLGLFHERLNLFSEILPRKNK